jgi:hypothetical protein
VPKDAGIDVRWSCAAALSADGLTLAVDGGSFAGTGVGRILFFEVETGRLTKVLWPENQVQGLQFLADGRLVSVGDVATVWKAVGKHP